MIARPTDMFASALMGITHTFAYLHVMPFMHDALHKTIQTNRHVPALDLLTYRSTNDTCNDKKTFKSGMFMDAYLIR